MTTPASTGDSGRNPSRHLVELLAQALVDQELRDKLFADREAVARRFHLSFDETEAIKRLDRRKFEHAAQQLRWN